MTYNIRNVTPADLDAVTALEARCFPPAEAAGREAFAYRIASFPERFFVAESEGTLIGMVNGCASSLPRIEDRLFEPQGHEPSGRNQMVFGLAVDEPCRRRGIGASLLHKLGEFAREQAMERVILTCKAERIRFYERCGYENHGVSQSTHGGAVWYDMVREL